MLVSDVIATMLTFWIQDSIAPSVLWGCLEISTQVVSACIPSLMPLVLSLFGKGRRSRDRKRYDPYQKDELSGSKQKVKPDSNRFTDLLSLGEAEPLPEAIDPSMITRVVGPDETANLGLVEAGKRSQSGIVVTDRIEQYEETQLAVPEGVKMAN